MTRTRANDLDATRKEFERSFRALRKDLRQEWGLSWKSAQTSLLVLAAAVGFGLAVSSCRRRAGVKRSDA